MTIDNLITWIDTEITKADTAMSKEPSEAITRGYFARVRLLRFARVVVMEFVKKFGE